MFVFTMNVINVTGYEFGPSVSAVLAWLVVVLFSVVVLSNVHRWFIQIDKQNSLSVLTAGRQLQRLTRRRVLMRKAKEKLEDEAINIFTLYDITKEITKSLHEEVAFEIFEHKLKEHVDFSECRMLDAQAEEVKEIRKKKDYFIFSLIGKRKRIGYLVIRGVREEDKEKIMILGHQFALALRRVKLHQEIERIAITDSLTGVYTRRYTLDRLREEIERSSLRGIHMAFLMVDVDYFKNFNDKYGHITGDQILREIGLIIRENIREIDIAGRYGGEEFCVVLPDTDIQGGLYAAERIRAATEKAIIKAYDTRIKATVSVGIATFPNDGTKYGEIIDRADWALYKAKKQGRNRACSFSQAEA